MKVIGKSLIIVILLMLLLSTTALAQDAEPVGGCPDSFHLHNAMDHGDGHADHMHHHIGNDKDQNGDGYLCVKHVGKDGKNHVHIDNNVPLN